MIAEFHITYDDNIIFDVTFIPGILLYILNKISVKIVIIFGPVQTFQQKHSRSLNILW